MSACLSVQNPAARGKYTLHGLVLLTSALACSDPHPGPQVGSNSNWLRACSTDEACAQSLDCQCGACTKTCRSDSDCEPLSDAWCVLEGDPGAQALCGGSDAWSSAGMCRPRCQPGTCGAGQVCVLLACTPLEVLGSGECADIAGQRPDAELQEEELLDAVERARLDGTVPCADAASPPAAAVRPDARLFCAARLLAADLAAHGGTSVIDSQGRDTAARMQLAGYTPSLGAEGVAVGAERASSAWAAMLQSADFCAAAVSAQLVDVGVGVWDGVYVLTMGAE